MSQVAPGASTTTTPSGSPRATLSASAGVVATPPGGTATPYSRSNPFA